VIANYFETTYSLDIFAPEIDSLEGVMARLYPDLFNSLLAQNAMTAFRALLDLFARRLADTTNTLHATKSRYLYRILASLLARGTDPCDITIITFNQDLQAEKVLLHLSKAKRWQPHSPQLFAFPALYAVPVANWTRVSAPAAADKFPESTHLGACLQVLKLHGSMNWYSTHTSQTPSREALFNRTRRLSVTTRTEIASRGIIQGLRTVYAFPVVVPPITHKSSVMPASLGPLWALAERRLIEADDVVIFGYSCPALDFESANMLARAQRQRPKASTLSVIDPNGSVAARYANLLAPTRLNYYKNADAFLTAQ